LFDESQETAQINVPKIGRRLSTWRFGRWHFRRLRSTKGSKVNKRKYLED
jgi:hypothetical protein